MSIRPIQKYVPKKLYKPVRIIDIKDIFFEENFDKYRKNIIKDYIYYPSKVLIA